MSWGSEGRTSEFDVQGGGRSQEMRYCPRRSFGSRGEDGPLTGGRGTALSFPGKLEGCWVAHCERWMINSQTFPRVLTGVMLMPGRKLGHCVT